MVDLLSDKQYKEIMATIKKKINIFQNNVQKIKQEIFVTQSTEQSTNQKKESPMFK